MPESLEPLILDLLEWLGPDARPYAEVMDAWRTSCPGLPVWEEANERGLVEQQRKPGRGVCVSVSALGAQFLQRSGRPIRTTGARVSKESRDPVARK